jgi:hypothetical protein
MLEETPPAVIRRSPPRRCGGLRTSVGRVEPAPEERLFADRPVPLALFRAIRRRIERLGPTELTATATQVSFGARRKFAWVWLPQRWTGTRPPDSVTLTFGLDHEVEDPRIAQAVEPRRGRWTHHVVITHEDELDGAVEAWLREAYILAGGGPPPAARPEGPLNAP